MTAYVMRYGHQPLSEIESLTYTELAVVTAELSDIVREENGKNED